MFRSHAAISEKLLSKDWTMREATRKDLPKGIEAQCPICWRLFGSDSACEMHKPYRGTPTTKCKEPNEVGLESRDRRGLAVWVRQAPLRGKYPNRSEK